MKKLIVGIITGLACLSCVKISTENASPTYREAFFAEEELIGDFLIEAWPENMLELDSGWTFMGKDSLPGIERVLPEFGKGENLNLPHRISFPNHSLWYQKEVNLEKGILFIDGDDGVQLWANEVRIPRAKDGEFFPIASEGEFRLTIRVVNNAMAGGLRKVRWISEERFADWQNQKKYARDSILAVRKVQLLNDSVQKSNLERLTWVEKKQELEDFPVLMTDPVLMLGADQTWFVRWVSEKGGEASIRLSTGEKLELNAVDGIFTLPFLEDSIRFELFQDKVFQGSYEFVRPEFGDQVKLALWGDAQGGWATFHQIAHLIREKQVDLSIGAGDLVNNGSEEYAYPRFLQKLSLMNTAQLPVPGNHDYDGFYEDLDPVLLRSYVFRAKEPRYGFQQVGPLAILTLDPNENFPVSIPENSAQRKMVEQVLNSDSWNQSPWKMIVLHQPPYSQGWPGYHGEKSIRDLLEPYFHQGKIDLVVAGHTHDYERLTMEFSGNTVQFLIVGGAGGGLEPEGQDSDFPKMDRIIKKNHVAIAEVNKAEFKLQVFGITGEVLDEVTFRKKP
ncbi:calcineurin-like phosphoesterase family protein [Algoriphagus aquaeductus]|uniref:Calcineurin-like phosphoesterase family protein n=1 Tax=Algoriphagus aquaeductus TaxID=475299 RepID=A0A326RLB9_9BACT|nr:metallophosphoesterase [Algoriphagus aquaeductus]PZV77171.1 calcineurin-like phosphoesterase family protein [Algoriphagus aquaeductus]